MYGKIEVGLKWGAYFDSGNNDTCFVNSLFLLRKFEKSLLYNY